MIPGLIILVCRNGLAYSRACLRTLLAQSVPVRVLLVDNASADGTAGWARSEQARDPRIGISSYREVASVARAWNDALRWAWEAGRTEALVVNNDVEIQPDTLRLLTEYETDAGMVTCVSRRPGESLEYTEGDWAEREHPDFSCYLMKRWAWEQVGGFDERCGGGFIEDNIFHVEAHRRGIRCVCIDLPFLHHASMTIKNADAAERRRIQKHAAENRDYFWRTYGCLPGTKGYERLFSAAGQEASQAAPSPLPPEQWTGL